MPTLKRSSGFWVEQVLLTKIPNGTSYSTVSKQGSDAEIRPYFPSSFDLLMLAQTNRSDERSEKPSSGVLVSELQCLSIF
jgi:hypothetical protein